MFAEVFKEKIMTKISYQSPTR